LPLLTKYEKARVLGERAQQLNAGAKPMVDVEDHVMDGYLIAFQEFEAKKIPFIIKRPLRNGSCEYWKFCDLECL
jgi:DNA-directed RNA polymerase I, II, and III subunit RPABC2